MTEWLGLPPLASAHGAQIDSLIGWTHVFMFVLFIGWGSFVAYALIRFRRSRNPVANYTGVTSNTANYLEVGVLLIEMVLLFAFSIPLWAGIEPVQEISRLAAAIEHAVVEAGVEPETRAFSPHLTLARRGMQVALGIYCALMVAHAATGISALGWHMPLTIVTYLTNVPHSLLTLLS